MTRLRQPIRQFDQKIGLFVAVWSSNSGTSLYLRPRCSQEMSHRCIYMRNAMRSFMY